MDILMKEGPLELVKLGELANSMFIVRKFNKPWYGFGLITNLEFFMLDVRGYSNTVTTLVDGVTTTRDYSRARLVFETNAMLLKGAK